MRWTRKAKRILAGAASLVIGGGLALGVTLNQSAQSEGIETCEQWRRLIRKADSKRDDVTFYVLVQDGYAPPEAVGDKVLGAVDGAAAAGRIHATPGACETGLEYEYKRSAAVNGWRLYRLDGDKYFARSWQVLASGASEVRFLGGWADVVDACLAVTTAQQCRDLLTDVSDCWRLGSSARYPGNLCRHGLEYGRQADGSGLGGVLPGGGDATCSPDAQSVPYPCRDRGRGRDWAERAVAEALDVSEE